MKTAINFMYWANNKCVPMTKEERLNWFIEVFGSHLGNHFFDKWESNKNYKTSTEKMLNWFFFQMSSGNQELLLKHIDETYKH